MNGSWHPDQEKAWVIEELAEQERQWDRLSPAEQAAQAARFASRYEDAEARYRTTSE